MGLSEACYMSQWNKCDTSVCKSLAIIMERGKKPVVLRAGKLFSLTLTTLMKVCLVFVIIHPYKQKLIF